MKKKILSLLAIITITAVAVLFTACSKPVNVPGAAWAKQEVLIYDIKENDAKIGTYTTEIVKLSEGNVDFKEVREQPFAISSSMKGIKLTQTAKDNDGNIIMRSVSILDGVSSVASYKMVAYNDKSYTVKGYFEGKYYHYSTDDGAWKKVKAKSGFIDNELLYTTIRGYKLDGGYSQTAKIFIPTTGNTENININVTNVIQPEYTIKYTDISSGEQKSQKVKCYSATFSKSKAPIGSSIEVWYSQDFELHGKGDTPGNYSYNIPVKIKENNLTYDLVLATAE